MNKSDFYSKYDSTYNQAWSVIYFLLNSKSGKYKPGFQEYLEAWKKKYFSVTLTAEDTWIQDKESHLKIFEQSIGIPIDQLENEWKEYILSLK